jgi:hypothetical protein
MVQLSFVTSLVAAIGTAPLLAAGMGAAGEAAISLPAITMLTDPEDRMASAAAANPLTENYFAMNRHARPQTGLDNGSRSWQVRKHLRCVVTR